MIQNYITKLHLYEYRESETYHFLRYVLTVSIGKFLPPPPPATKFSNIAYKDLNSALTCCFCSKQKKLTTDVIGEKVKIYHYLFYSICVKKKFVEFLHSVFGIGFFCYKLVYMVKPLLTHGGNNLIQD